MQNHADRLNDLGNKKVSHLLFKLSLPAITAQLVNLMYMLVDRIFIGHMPDIGAVALTGVGICMPLIMIISAFAALASVGGASRAAIMVGKNNHEEAEKIVGNCAFMLVLLSVILTAVFLIFGDKLLILFGASEKTIGYASEYLRIYTYGTIFVQLTLGLNAFITTQGFALTSMLTVMIGAILNTILDPIFIFVLKMGVSGAAIATIVSQAVSAIWVVWFLCGKKTLLKLRLKNFRFSPKVILPCLALGLSPFIMQATESIIGVCFNSSLLKYGGDTAVGAMTILLSIMQFSMLPLQGLTQGAQPITSYNFGAKNADRVKQTFKLLLISSLIYSATIWILAMAIPEFLAKIFASDVSLINYTKWALRFYMCAAVTFGAQLACQQTFVAIGNAKTSLFLAILRKVILLIPLIYILPLIFTANKPLAVFIAEPIADVIAVSVTITLFTISFKKALKKLKTEI